ncbi:MAG: hypothetical protein Q4B78_02515, partial [Bacillota bacterium]|nr:hypothetical protein [Bacillota bacterium]
GAYFIGVAIIIHFYAYRNTLSRILIAVPYIVSVVLSLVAIMGMTSASELLMLAPHIAIIVVIIVVVKMRGKLSSII